MRRISPDDRAQLQIMTVMIMSWATKIGREGWLAKSGSSTLGELRESIVHKVETLAKTGVLYDALLMPPNYSENTRDSEDD